MKSQRRSKTRADSGGLARMAKEKYTKESAAIALADLVDEIRADGWSIQICHDPDDELLHEVVVYDAPDSSFGIVAFEDED